ncbi:iron-sulfur cluster assembly accessory protein [Calidifontibacillus erzurumensis]|uniref:Uncharacterized protein n=1 Tax=Calidifontibacillus erzurumensis TaxID=2741433 RepID=A0A8J8KAP1_9BACI|nr:hypothetical protein [Calidifontibacillus erzurumensis]NSL51054.1 hypothetical protein [Calidifontibacillus erzurumensis]
MSLEETALPTDEVFVQDGVTFLLNKRDKHFFEGLALDFRKSWFGGSFTLVDAKGNEVGGGC